MQFGFDLWAAQQCLVSYVGQWLQKLCLHGTAVISTTEWCVIYAALQKIPQKRQVDESHYLKNRKSKRAQCLIPVLKAANRALLLSGTPALARYACGSFSVVFCGKHTP
jgi:hypothetical protein